MPTLPGSLFWERRDTAGAEHALVDARTGLYARGTALAVDPVPYTCRYELQTDPSWTTTRFEVSAEGPGWARTVRLELAAGRWRVTTSEQGNLDAALTAAGHAGAGLPGTEDPDLLYGAFDVDLGGSPLTNTLPIRRLDLQVGEPVTILAAWVQLPSLAVIPNEQTYTLLGPGKVRYSSGTFAADLDVDDDGYVTHYPGLASLVTD
jgi:uncharacterized protein